MEKPEIIATFTANEILVLREMLNQWVRLQDEFVSIAHEKIAKLEVIHTGIGVTLQFTLNDRTRDITDYESW